MKNEDIPKRRVKIIKLIWWIPHFRAPIFRRLSQNPNLDFVVCAGDNTRGPGGVHLAASANQVGNAEGINWRRLDSYYIKAPIFKDYEWQPEAVRIAWKENMDALICLGPRSLSNWLVRAICRCRRIPVIEWSHGVTRPEGGLKWAVKKAYMKLANAHLFYGRFARDFFVSRGFDEASLFVVNNSLDHNKQVEIREQINAEDIRRTRAEFGVSRPEDRLLFHSGRMKTVRKLPLLIGALRILRDRGRRVFLVLIGKGEQEEALRTGVDDNGIGDRVVFYGSCYEEDTLGRIISASDLCVVPSQTGLIAMHSLVYGTPLLTCENTSWGHTPEVEAIVEGETGGFFREGDVDDLARKVEAMLYPEPCKSRMSKACMQMIDSHYTPEYQERVIIQALNYVLPKEKKIPLPGVRGDSQRPERC